MKRRSFITLLGGAAAWPMAARAQQPAMPVIGFLSGGGDPNPDSLAAWKQGLSEMGFVENRNVAIEYRSAVEYDRLVTLANEFVRRPVNVILAASTANAVEAAKSATTTIPIVFSNGSDPVKLGLVSSLNRPGGNATGVSYYASALGAKRLELLRELVPQVGTIALLTNPANLNSEGTAADIQTAAHTVGQRLIVLRASTETEIDAAFETIAREGVGAVLVDTDAVFNRRRDQLAALAKQHRIPTSYASRGYVAAGGLISYGDDRLESHRQAGLYTGRILKGEKPADLPILQPTKFELVVNLKTAKAIGLSIPESFLLRADEVIE